VSCRVRKKKVGGAKLYRNGWLAPATHPCKTSQATLLQLKKSLDLRRGWFALKTTIVCLFVCLSIKYYEDTKDKGRKFDINQAVRLYGNGSALISLR
jgi:hypothetical protein